MSSPSIWQPSGNRHDHRLSSSSPFPFPLQAQESGMRNGYGEEGQDWGFSENIAGGGGERKYYWQEKPPYCALGMAWNVFTLLFLVAQSCLTLCNFTDCSLPGSSVHGIFLARIWNGCHFHLQGIFLTQGSNLGLLHWQADPLPLSCLGSPFSGYKPSMLLIV